MSNLKKHKLFSALNERILLWLQFMIVIIIAIFPNFLTFPYRINIFLSWEGAYRIANDQIPFRDFGLPLGYAYWIIPGIFFKVFGPYFLSLIKAQTFINIVAGFSFIYIFKKIGVKSTVVFIGLVLFCLSYTLINFWPWYNHTVFVFQLVSILLITLSIDRRKIYLILFVLLSGFFSFLSFFTKQDGGGLAILINLALILYLSIIEKDYYRLLFYLVGIFVGFLIFINPLLKYEFTYWFNYGQDPHFSRLTLSDLVDAFFRGSMWIKFYLGAVIIILLNTIIRRGKDFLSSKYEIFHLILILGILFQASIIQVTSYVPINNNIYFHSFAVVFLLSYVNFNINKSSWAFLVISSALIFLWWSGSYYKYIDKYIDRLMPASKSKSDEVVSFKTYRNNQGKDESQDISRWIKLPDRFKSYRGLFLPESTVEGILALEKSGLFDKNDLKVLNMTELTSLAYEFDFELESGMSYPLWFHQNVSFFDREYDFFQDRINNNYYDIILFERIPNLNNFYPLDYEVYLDQNYRKYLTIDAPRKHGGDPKIIVYIK